MMMGGQDSNAEKRVQCEICMKYYHSTSIRRHIRNQHSQQNEAAFCEVCQVTFKNDGVKKDHMRRRHNVYQTASEANILI